MVNAQSTTKNNKELNPVCGIIMPIAAMPPKYEASHWSDVRKIFDAAITNAGLTPQIVSDSFESDVIQQRIISNLYDNPVVICDVSGLNPNVMFELGMRITFKQPVIIVTDDFASIPFDTKIIEHLGYPRDLHIHQTNEFIEKLSYRIIKLFDQKKDGSFKSFIEAFGTYDVLEPTKKVVEADQLILDRLDMLDRSIGRIVDQENRYKHGSFYSRESGNRGIRIDFGKETPDDVLVEVMNRIRNFMPASKIEIDKGPKGQSTLSIIIDSSSDIERRSIEAQIKKTISSDIASYFNIRWI